MMRISILFLLIAPPALAERVLEPVPASSINGPTLSLPELNLAIDAPSRDWEWLESTSETGGKGPNRFRKFFCRLRADASREFAVAAFDPFWAPLTPDSASRVVAGVVSSLEKQGWKATTSGPVAVDTPLPGSFRFVVSAENAAGARIQLWNYVAVQDRMYMFQHAGVEGDEPAAFDASVRSLRVIGEPWRPLDGLAPLHGLAAFIVVGLGGVVGWIVNRIAGRVVVNVWTAVVPILIALGAGLAFFWSSRLPDDLEPFRQGEAIGYAVIGPFFWFGVFAFWRFRALSKRRAVERGL